MTRKLIQTKKTTLAYGINDSATTMRLTNLLKLDGSSMTASDIGDYLTGTFDPGTSREEIFSIDGADVTVNGDGTIDIVNVVRGLKEVDPYTTGGFATDHPAGAVVVFGNNPQLYRQFGVLADPNTWAEVQTFTVLPESDGGNATDGRQLVTYAQAQSMLTGGGSLNKVVVAGNGGEVLVAGDSVYLDSADSEWKKTDANTAGTVNNVIKGIAQGAGTDGGAIANGVLLFGLDANQTGRTPGAIQYFSDTAGELSESAGTVEVTAGQAISATEVLFFPSFNQQLTEDQQDALAGTVGTPSDTNRYVTDDDTTGTGDIIRESALTAFNGSIFGDGSDGAVVYDGVATILGMAPAANVYTLTRNIYCTNITIDVGVTIKTAGYRIYATGTLTNNGTIRNTGNDGTNGGNASASTGGTAGSAGATPSANTVIVGQAGTAGGVGVSINANGLVGAVGSAQTNSAGTAGGTGGTGGATTGNGGASGGIGGTLGALTAANTTFRDAITALTQTNLTGLLKLGTGGTGGGSGSASNASGGNNASGGGGGGGGTGGLVFIVARALAGNGVVSAVGGTGGNGGNAFTGTGNSSAGGGAGGGGGSGGCVLIVTSTSANPFTVTVTGGTAGTGGTGSNSGAGYTGANGATGSNGTAGVSFYLNI